MGEYSQLTHPYLALRKAVGLTGILLPFVLMLGVFLNSGRDHSNLHQPLLSYGHAERVRRRPLCRGFVSVFIAVMTHWMIGPEIWQDYSLKVWAGFPPRR